MGCGTTLGEMPSPPPVLPSCFRPVDLPSPVSARQLPHGSRTTASCQEKKETRTLFVFSCGQYAVSDGTANCWWLAIRDQWMQTTPLLKQNPQSQETILFLTATRGICVIP